MSQKKEKKINLNELTEEELLKYEVAEELGLLDRVLNQGWKSLSSKETGRIGGMVNRKKREKKEQKSYEKGARASAETYKIHSANEFANVFHMFKAPGL